MSETHVKQIVVIFIKDLSFEYLKKIKHPGVVVFVSKLTEKKRKLAVLNHLFECTANGTQICCINNKDAFIILRKIRPEFFSKSQNNQDDMVNRVFF